MKTVIGAGAAGLAAAIRFAGERIGVRDRRGRLGAGRPRPDRCRQRIQFRPNRSLSPLPESLVRDRFHRTGVRFEQLARRSAIVVGTSSFPIRSSTTSGRSSPPRWHTPQSPSSGAASPGSPMTRSGSVSRRPGDRRASPSSFVRTTRSCGPLARSTPRPTAPATTCRASRWPSSSAARRAPCSMRATTRSSLTLPPDASAMR